MSKTELSLLLFLETCAVDHAGRIRTDSMNDDDRKIAERWNATGYVSYGRVCYADAVRGENAWCRLSATAFEDAHSERRARAERMWASKKYRTTEEARSE